MLNLISNIRTSRLNNQNSEIGFKSKIYNYTTDELVPYSKENSVYICSKNWIDTYR